jgi:hypothetical protein
LYICAKYASIDGNGRVLGYSGPTAFRSGRDGLPITGRMVLDTADLVSMKGNGTFAMAILHEMGHMLGIGTLWRKNRVTRGYYLFWCRYIGANGNREYRELSGCTSSRLGLPLEWGGSRGTRCGHFSEKCFRNELMTGYANPDGPLSRLTIATLQDLGYKDVDYSQADPYTADDLSPSCRCNNGRSLRSNTVAKAEQIEPNDNTNSFNNNNDKNYIRKNSMHRELSEEGRKYATNFGIKILKEEQEQEQQNKATTASVTIKNGRNSIIVLYWENDRIHDVHVSTADIN